ncbi:hypothetical protein NG800_015520, partial [Epilithonimonas ginsengisoli]|nr:MULTISPECIES: hypothetical protein [Chryseobacterium group]MBV6881369.1 hypothetical protein [Epilithonimonas sp. FP105]MDW8550337.1 hypothetical protein [Epilithonimonas ginsengisoli]OAH68304.1 hypothetical protein AXA65_17115 [Chryseobacterium sp. FP211-J200]
METDFFKELYKNISIEEIINRINYFNNNISAKNLSEENLQKEIQKIFQIELNNKKYSLFNNKDIFTVSSEKYYFFRVRTFSENDNFEKRIFHSMKCKQDLLWVPEKNCNMGRLNRPGNPVLYISRQATNAIYETRLKVGDYFYLIIYENLKPMRIAQVHNPIYLYEFDELENAKRLLFHNFLLNEFTKYVPEGMEYLYKTSILIYENYFKTPYIDAFSYPSIATEAKIGMNFCLSTEKVERNLKTLGVMVCKLCEGNSSAIFNVEIYYDGFLEDDKINFYNY